MFRPRFFVRSSDERTDSGSFAAMVQSAFGVFGGALTSERLTPRDLIDQRTANDEAQR